MQRRLLAPRLLGIVARHGQEPAFLRRCLGSLPGRSGQAVVRRHGRALLRPKNARHVPDVPANVEEVIYALQGEWGDDQGLVIHVNGHEAYFGDGGKVGTLEKSHDGTLSLRGAALVGPVTAPVWRFPDGLENHWARTEPFYSGDARWRFKFLRFKEDRLQLRQRLQQAFDAVELEEAIVLKSQWMQGDAVPRGLTPLQASTLLAGRWLVPGTCFRHKKFNYRGVVLACDPWCTFPTAWRARWVPNRPAGEAQPFYHCIVDERDREGQQTRYVAQENMELESTVFPIQARLADAVFKQSDELGCYLPNAILQDALRKQRAGSGFRL